MDGRATDVQTDGQAESSMPPPDLLHIPNIPYALHHHRASSVKNHKENDPWSQLQKTGGYFVQG